MISHSSFNARKISRCYDLEQPSCFKYFFNARTGAQTRQNTKNTLVVVEFIWREIVHILFALITLTFITANRVHNWLPR
jgi:hypothetical protein